MNVLPSEKPQDVYSDVCAMVEKRVAKVCPDIYSLLINIMCRIEQKVIPLLFYWKEKLVGIKSTKLETTSCCHFLEITLILIFIGLLSSKQ